MSQHESSSTKLWGHSLKCIFRLPHWLKSGPKSSPAVSRKVVTTIIWGHPSSWYKRTKIKLVVGTVRATIYKFLLGPNFKYVLIENWLYMLLQKRILFIVLSVKLLNNNCCSFIIYKFCISLYCLEFFAFKSKWYSELKHLKC